MKFTASQRKAIYGAVAAGTALLLAFNVITAEQLTLSVDSLTQLITAATSLLAFMNTHPEA